MKIYISNLLNVYMRTCGSVVMRWEGVVGPSIRGKFHSNRSLCMGECSYVYIKLFNLCSPDGKH